MGHPLLKLNERMLLVQATHNASPSVGQVIKLVENSKAMEEKIVFGLELNKSDAFFVTRTQYRESEFYMPLKEAANHFLFDMSHLQLVKSNYTKFNRRFPIIYYSFDNLFCKIINKYGITTDKLGNSPILKDYRNAIYTSREKWFISEIDKNLKQDRDAKFVIISGKRHSAALI